MNYYKFYAIIRDKFDLFLERRLIVSLQQFERKSLQEINQSIDVPKGIPFWKTLLLFSGPGSLVAVGYMDPGNWITSVVGGAQYRYLLLSVVLLSSLIAMQLQQMAGKLGIVHRKDLAQTTAHHLPRLRLHFLLEVQFPAPLFEEGSQRRFLRYLVSIGKLDSQKLQGS